MGAFPARHGKKTGQYSVFTNYCTNVYIYEVSFLRYCAFYIPFFHWQVARLSLGRDISPECVVVQGKTGPVLGLSPGAYRRRRGPGGEWPSTPPGTQLGTHSASQAVTHPSTHSDTHKPVVPPGAPQRGFSGHSPEKIQLSVNALHAAEAVLSEICGHETPSFILHRGSVLLDLEGMARLHGSDQRAWLQRLLAKLTSAGFGHVRAALAPTASAARILGAISHAPADPCYTGAYLAESLNRVGWSRLPFISQALRRKLRQSGMPTLGHVARLGLRGSRSRFGAEGEYLYALARGADVLGMAAFHHDALGSSEAVAPLGIAPHSGHTEAAVFDPPLSLRATLRLECRALAARLNGRLHRESLLPASFLLRVVPETGNAWTCEKRITAKEGAEGVPFEERVLSLLQGFPDSAGAVVGLQCAVPRTRVISLQEDLFGRGL